MISIVISILAFLFSVITYFIQDYKLKKQETLLNQYKLMALTQVEEENKKAIIRAKTINISGGKRILYIINIGKAKARNVIVSLGKVDQVFVTRPQMPVTYDELLPDSSREIHLFLTEGDDEITLNYSWNDDFSSDNNESQTIDL